MQYEQLTGKVLIKDSNLAANALPITISVPQPVPKGELVRLIEASLLLNNIVLVPAQEPNTVKVININTGKNPRSEGVRLFTGPEVLVQICLSVCFCRVNDFPDFRPPRPWPTFPERWLLFRLVG